MQHNYIVIEGNIGSGKTSLVRKLAADYQAQIILEEFEENPFLSEFLESQTKNNLAVELQFLIDRYHQLNKVDHSTKIVSDYFIDKSLIFSSANLTPAEKQLFDNYFSVLFKKTRKPDLLVYLDVQTDRLLENIEKRGRTYEKTIDAAYLQKVHNSYLNYFETLQDQPILIVDTSSIDFVSDPSHYEDLKAIVTADHPKGVNIKQLA